MTFPTSRVLLDDAAAVGLTLTPTSTPRKIYAQITTLKQLRRQSNVFEAALLTEQQVRDTEQQVRDSIAGTTTEKRDDRATRHSTCYHLYEAVTSFKKRHKDKYVTLQAAFEAHRRKKLGQDQVTSEGRSSLPHAAEHTAPITAGTSTPASAWASSPAVAAVSAPEVASPSTRPAADIRSEQQPHNDHDDRRAPYVCDIPTAASASAFCASFCQLSDAVRRIQSHVSLVEAEARSLQTQLRTMQSLLHLPTTAARDDIQIIAAVFDHITGVRPRAPVREERAIDCEAVVETQARDDQPATTIASSSRSAVVRQDDQAKSVTQYVVNQLRREDDIDININDASPAPTPQHLQQSDTDGGADDTIDQLRRDVEDGSSARMVDSEEHRDHTFDECDYGDYGDSVSLERAAVATDEVAELQSNGYSAQPSAVDSRYKSANDTRDGNTDGGTTTLTSQNPQRNDRVGDVTDQTQQDNEDGSKVYRRSSKRSYSSSQDDGGEERSERMNSHVSWSIDRRGYAAATSTDSSYRRCIWVQSREPMHKVDLERFFSCYGWVERVDVPAQRSGCLPFAFVHFTDEGGARYAIRAGQDGSFGRMTVKAYQRPRRDASHSFGMRN